MKQVRGRMGQFKKTTGNEPYKRVMYNGITTTEQSRTMLILLGLDKFPKGFIVHHIDENKRNNDIDNLALMTYTAHNRLHAKDRNAWNKGLKAENSEKLRKILKKALASRKGNYINNKCKPTYLLHQELKSYRKVAKELGISRETASLRSRHYREFLDLNK